jgi:hypothetical protein
MLVFEPHAKYAMKHADDPREEELRNLRLALATFALQLDVFEMRTNGVLLAVGKPGKLGPRPSSGRGSRKDNVIGDQ